MSIFPDEIGGVYSCVMEINLKDFHSPGPLQKGEFRTTMFGSKNNSLLNTENKRVWPLTSSVQLQWDCKWL